MQYFDFHTHVILKQLFDENPNIDAIISPGDVAGIPRLCTDLPNIIETQIHQSQLAEFSDEVIVGAVLYGLESYLASAVIPLRPYLKGSSQHKLSLQLLQDIADNKFHSYTDFAITRTFNSYLQASSSFNILTNQSFNNPLPKNKVSVFFIVEGCHTFVNTINAVQLPAQRYDPQEILSNLDLLLQKAKVLAINVTHMQQSSLCNHAFGMQIADVKPFYPHGNGLEDDGRTVIKGIMDRGIHVDLKHMSYKSRLDLRNEIDAGKYSNTMPLVCTHTGFTGIPFSQWPGFMWERRTIDDVWYIEMAKTMQVANSPQRPGAPAFNMTTINLFDEEIVWIVKHGGMIGLSMDRRILGYVSKYDDRPTGIHDDSSLIVDKEYFSKTEWTALGLPDAHGSLISDQDCVSMQDIEDSAEGSLPARNEYFYDHVLLHLKHFLQVCYRAQIPLAEAQRHITIGSDFDGLINPFINFSTVQDMHDLKQYIDANFRIYAAALTDSSEWASTFDFDLFTRQLFYQNGYDFVKSFFQR
ncbi:amidohydrolase family protein [Chitinophaga vietnamensis]|uniref:hypothetical protein n=1 Tax=Chitinophaga vietnamensis TaxID=2593957 RepID=UPI001178B333|nr:hypothetical protein [Chitinophaga vietnamensis]